MPLHQTIAIDITLFNVQVNHALLDQWSDGFIPQDLLDSVGVVDDIY
jgi:hypothetical protein